MSDVERPVGDGSEVDVSRRRLSSRRNLLLMGLTAAGGAAAATGAEMLTTGPAGAAAGDPILVDDTTTGAGGTTIVQPTASSPTFGANFRAAIQDWGGQVYNVLAYGALGDGNTADAGTNTTAIGNAQAAAAAAGGGCVYFPAGIYYVNPLTIDTTGQVFKLEAGASLIAAPSITGPVITVNAPGVSILGPGTIDGNASGQPGPTFTGLDCVMFTTNGSSGGDDALVEGLVIQNAAWLGIEATNVNRTRVVLNRILNCGQGGVSCKATSTGTFEGPTIIGNRVSLTGTSVNAGINVQGTSTADVIIYAVVTDNQVNIPSTSTALAYQVLGCEYSRVVGNHGRSQGQVFSLSGGTDNVLMGNTALAIGNGAGIELGSNYTTCVGNTVAATGTGAGIHADNNQGTHVVICNNKVVGAQNAGIGVASYDHVVVTGNIVHQSGSADTGFGVIQVSPANAGLVVIADNVLDAASASQYGVLLDNLTSVSVQTLIHDNTVVDIPTAPDNAAFRFGGAGVVTDLVVHDNSIGSGIPIYTTAPGLSFGTNVRFDDNIVVGGAPGFGVTPVTLPASGSPYTNPGPYKEILYLQGGRLGPGSGVVKNGRNLVPSGVIMKTPVAVWLDPQESVTVYYTVTPVAWKDIKN